jgi:ABC-type sugar transport system substrate-binding protein
MLPINYSEAGAVGAADTDPVSVSGIKTGDILLAVIQWAPEEDAEGLDLTDYPVGDGTITGATIDTTGKLLWVVWCGSFE